MRLILIVLFVLVPLAAGAQSADEGKPGAAAEVDPRAAELAREIIGLTQASDSLEQIAGRIVGQMAPAFERANPGQGELVREILETEFLAVFREHEDNLAASLAPVYTANFTVQDLEGLVAFYKSPLGQKLIAAQPEVARQAMRMGGMWGQKLGELATVRAIERMQAEGLETNI